MERAAQKPSMMQAFRALHVPNYRIFWLGQLVSLIGTWMQSIAQAWLVLKITDSAFALGTVTMVQTLPFLLLSLVGGVIADRVRKRRLLLTTQSIMLAGATVLAIVTATGHVTLPLIYIVAAIMGTANAIDNPARQAFVSELVGPDDLPNAVALNSAQFNAARLVGPALGGVAIATIGVAGCFFVNAASFVAVIGALLLMDGRRMLPAAGPRGGSMLSQIAEGLGYARRTPDVALIVLLMAVIGTFGYNFQVILPLIARFVLHSGSAAFGLLSSASAAGSLGGALLIAYLGRAKRRTLMIGATGFSITLLLLGVARWWVAIIPILVVMGLFSIVFTATASTRLQLITPPHLRGRVMSIYTLLFLGSTPIGGLIVGWVAEHYGVERAVIGSSIVCLLGVAAGMAYLRRVHDQLPPDIVGQVGEHAPSDAPAVPTPTPARGTSGD